MCTCELHKMEIISSIADKGHSFNPFSPISSGDFTQVLTHTLFNLYFIHTDLNIFAKRLYEYLKHIFLKNFKYVSQNKD